MQTELSKEEQQVYDAIVNCESKITQQQIARKVWVGCHEKFEGYDTPKGSTTRKVRAIIRNLVMKHGLHILSSDEGYWVKKSDAEVQEYMDRFERQAKAAAKSYMERYHVMRKTFGISSKYFEKQIQIEFEQ